MAEEVQNKPVDDRGIDILISHILRGGVIASSILCAFGGLFMLLQAGNRPFNATENDEQLRSIPGILSLAVQGQPDGIVQLGVVVLLSTPFLRVLFAGIAFLKARDYVYVAIASAVLVGLAYSLFSASVH